eukprot:403353888
MDLRIVSSDGIRHRGEDYTIVHHAIACGAYQLAFYFIDEHGFNIDFYREFNKLTLLHVVAKHVNEFDFTDYDKKYICLLLSRSNNLFLRNNFGRTILNQAKTRNTKNNSDFLDEQMKLVVNQKMHQLLFLVEKTMKKHSFKVNKYIIREIYKYIDG